MQAGEQRAGFIGLHPTGPCARGGSIPMPITWPLWHKSLLIILILNIKLKWKVHLGRRGSLHTEKHVLCKQVGQALALPELWFSTWLHVASPALRCTDACLLPHPHHQESVIIDQGCGLGIGTFYGSPSDSNVQTWEQLLSDWMQHSRPLIIESQPSHWTFPSFTPISAYLRCRDLSIVPSVLDSCILLCFHAHRLSHSGHQRKPSSNVLLCATFPVTPPSPPALQ